MNNQKFNAVVTRIEDATEYTGCYFAHCDSPIFGKIKVFISPKVHEYNDVDSIGVGDKLFIIKSYNKFNQRMWMVKDVEK